MLWGQRWVAALANYNFKVIYHSGKQNTDADTLSRIPWDTEQVNATLERGLVETATCPTQQISCQYDQRCCPK